MEVRGAGRARVSFPQPVRTVAPGQSAVIYGGLVCLGGGIVEPDPVAYNR